jgi:hypothetical protein
MDRRHAQRGTLTMRKFILAAAALAAFSAAPAFAGEGTYQQGEVASGFMTRMMTSAMAAHRAGNSFQFTAPQGEFAERAAQPASGALRRLFGGSVPATAFSFTMSASQS